MKKQILILLFTLILFSLFSANIIIQATSGVETIDLADIDNISIINQAPVTPSNPFPADTQTNQALQVTLTWECSDIDSENITYDLFWGTTTNPELVASALTESSYALELLEEDTTYYWKVTASDGNSQVDSPEWSFTTAIIPDAPAGMVFVQGGTFQMGDRLGMGFTEELPLHQTTVSSFFIKQHELTQSEYSAIMGENPAHDYGVGPDHPVYYVTWVDAIEYCNGLSVQQNLTPCYDIAARTCDFTANGYRLPTEAEWEYAARGGVHHTDNFRYSGADDSLGDYAWYTANNSPHGNKEVGLKEPNQLNIYDMSGNSYEWCNDWFGDYSGEDQVNPIGPDDGTQKVRRGGGWGAYPNDCRVSHRYEGNPDYGNSGITIRVVKPIF